MKKLTKVALVAICILFVGNFAKAQTKIGYINFSDLVQAMPELKTVNTQMDAFRKPYMDQITTMQTELQTKSQAYQTKRATMADAARIAAEGELGDLQKRIQDYSSTAEKAVEAKGNELIKPVTDKAKGAVSAVAKEKGYTYVFDSSQVSMVVMPDGDDLLAAAKLKLGLK